MIQTLNRLGATRTMEAYLHYIDHIIASSNADTLQPLYGITGDPRAEEKIATSLSGYRGMGPVRFGNLAAEQVQHDVYGSVILAATQLFFDERLVRSGDQTLLERLYRLGKRAVATFEEPDAGPWEFRGKLQRHTFSAAISWAGLRPAEPHRAPRRRRDRGARVGARASYMRQEILTGAWSEERQAFTSAFGNRDLDATALLLPELGLLPATDPRFLKTLERIEEELRVGDLLFRYKHADDFGRPENAFTICAFWYVNALAAAGRVDEARERFTRLLERRNPLGLLSEDIQPVERRAVGQFSADLQHGGSHRQCAAALAQLGGDRMSRLVAVSNRISVPKRGAAPGGLAVGLLAAMQARRGLWFGWDGETADVGQRRSGGGAQGRRDLRVHRSRPGRVQGFLPRLLQRRVVAAVPLLRRRLPLQRHAVRGLPAHEPALCAHAACRCSSPTTSSGCTTITCSRWRSGCARRA